MAKKYSSLSKLKALKIIFAILLVILTVAIVFTYFFRHDILKHAFEVSIDKKTKQTIKFEIGDLHLNLFRSEITIMNSSFNFKNIYVDKNKSLEISKFEFNDLVVEGLSIVDLLFKEEIVASRFILSDPTFWFKRNNSDIRFHENTKQIVSGLKKHPDLLGDLVIIVDAIEITQGKIDLQRVLGQVKSDGIVKFRILLKDFNTRDHNIFSENRFLFAKNHFFGLYDFDYSFKNGNDLKFDSLIVSSLSNTIEISNVSLVIEDTTSNSDLKQLKANLDRFILSGINLNEVDYIEEISLDSIDLIDGNLSIITSSKNLKENKRVKQKPKIFEHLSKLLVNRFNLTNISLKYNDEKTNTIVSATHFNFQVDSLLVDSTVLSGKIPYFEPKSIILSIQELKLKQPFKGLSLDVSDIIIDDNSSTFGLNNVIFHDSVNGQHSFNVLADTVRLSGISVEDKLNGLGSNLGFYIVNPVIDIDLEKVRHRSENSKSTFTKGIKIDNINLSNGIITLKDKNKLRINLNGLSINWPDMGFDLTDHPQKLNTEELNIVVDKSSVEVPLNNMNSTTGKVVYHKNNFDIIDLRSEVISDWMNVVIRLNSLSLSDINPKLLLTDRLLTIGGISIAKPSVKAIINTKNKPVSNNSKVHTEPEFKILISSLNIANGNVDIKTDGKLESYESKLALDVSNINFGKTDWLSDLNWNLKLTEVKVHEEEFVFNIANAQSNSLSSNLILKNLVVGNNNSQYGNIQIKKLKVPDINVQGIDYKALINGQRPTVNGIFITDPTINVAYHNIRKSDKSNNNVEKANKLPADISQIGLYNANISMNIIDTASQTNINVRGMSFDYLLDSSDNILDDINKFEISSGSFSNDKANLFFSGINYIPEKENLKLSNVHFEDISNNDTIQLDITSIDIKNIYAGNAFPSELSIDSLLVKSAKVRIVSESDSQAKKVQGKKKFKLPKFLRSFTNNDLLVEDLDIDYNTHKKESSKFLNLDDISIDISDINIDSTKLVDNKIDFLRSMHIELNENKFISKDSLYSTGLGSVSYSFADSTLRVEDLSMVSRFNDEEFFKRAKYQVSRTNLEIGKLICSGLDINHFIQSKKLHINLVDVFGLKADIYKDKQYPIEPGKYVKMPQDMILDASQVMSIDSVRTFNSLIEYKELDIKSYEPGYVFLDSFNLNIYGISNDLQKLDSTSVLTARLNAKLMGVSPINMQTDFYMLSPSKKFTIKGHVNKIHFSELNRLTQNLVGITMKSGWGEVHIPLIRGDSSNTSGFIYFGYKKLKVELFNREKAKATKGLTGSMAGLILNDIFIKSNNPGLFGSTRPGEVYFKRDTQKFVVNYIWRSIQSGIMSTMGYNNREQRQEKRTWQKQNRANLKRIQTRSTK